MQITYGNLSFKGILIDVFSLLLAVILLKPREIYKRKDWVTEKYSQKNLCGRYFFGCTPSSCFFLSLFLSKPLSKWCAFWMTPIKLYSNTIPDNNSQTFFWTCVIVFDCLLWTSQQLLLCSLCLHLLRVFGLPYSD